MQTLALSHFVSVAGPVATAPFDTEGTFAIGEAQRRLGGAWKIKAEVRWCNDVNENDPLLGRFRRDSFVILRLVRYL